MGIGRNLAKARAYQKSHETFEGVVQNTYTNAEKLLAAAAELAQTGECNAEDIYSVAHELESHISSFAQRGMINFVYIRFRRISSSDIMRIFLVKSMLKKTLGRRRRRRVDLEGRDKYRGEQELEAHIASSDQKCSTKSDD